MRVASPLSHLQCAHTLCAIAGAGAEYPLQSALFICLSFYPAFTWLLCVVCAAVYISPLVHIGALYYHPLCLGAQSGLGTSVIILTVC